MGRGAEDGQAAVRRIDSGLPLDGAAQQPLGDLPCGGKVQHLSLVRMRTVRIAIERTVEQLLLRPERGVERGPVDVHGLAEVGQRRALVPELPEDENGAVERFVEVELARAAHRAIVYPSVQNVLDLVGRSLRCPAPRPSRSPTARPSRSRARIRPPRPPSSSSTASGFCRRAGSGGSTSSSGTASSHSPPAGPATPTPSSRRTSIRTRWRTRRSARSLTTSRRSSAGSFASLW